MKKTEDINKREDLFNKIIFVCLMIISTFVTFEKIDYLRLDKTNRSELREIK